MLRRRHVHRGEKRGALVGKTKRGKGTKLMVLADGKGTPLGVCMASASPSETKLLEPLLEAVAVKRQGPGRPRKRPKRLIGDRGNGHPKRLVAWGPYDSNAVRASLAARGIEPIIPARRNNTVATHQDGRRLRRYRRRWLVERTHAWLQNYRRVLVRYERLASLYLGFVHLACALVVLKKVLG
ncbi:MAG: IS5 family transposase [bacterium]